MINIQKFFLVFAWIYTVLSSLYAMTDNIKEANLCKLFALLEFQNKDFDQKDYEAIENILKKDLNINARDGYHRTSFSVLLGNWKKGSDRILRLLIQHGADINLTTEYYTPLEQSIVTDNLEGTEILCNAKASLHNPYGYNVFHTLATSMSTEKQIETIITHARFYPYNEESQKEYQQFKQKIMDIFLILKTYQIPVDLQYLILSKSIKFRFANEVNFLKKSYTCTQVKNRVENLKHLLQLKSNNRLTPLEAFNTFSNIQNKHLIRPYFDTRLYNDYEEFVNAFPNISSLPKDNLVCKIYNNCARLLE